MDDPNGTKFSEAWNIFYHFFPDQRSLSLLTSQARKLSDSSHDLDAWRAGPYASLVRMWNSHTLDQLHKHWELYAAAENWSTKRRKSTKLMFQDRMQDTLKEIHGHIQTGVRSAGPLFGSTSESSSNYFMHYWRTGITSTSKVCIESAKDVNPTFMHSLMGEGFNVHYGTYPFAAFHLAPIFSAPHAESTSITEITAGMKAQFVAWAKTFIEATSKQSLVLRFFSGDALRFCQALAYRNEHDSVYTDIPMHAWTSRVIHLDGDAFMSSPNTQSISFNAINTSNLADHVGILNLLVCTVPLLARSSSSSISTESLLFTGNAAMEALSHLLCGELGTMSLLLGIAPADYLSAFSTHSNAHEILMHRLSASDDDKLSARRPQYHERTT